MNSRSLESFQASLEFGCLQAKGYEPVADSFGERLRHHRKRSFDPVQQQFLTQARLAELLEETAGIRYTGAAVSEWERNQSQINKDDRILLVSLIKILHQYAGLSSVEEAQALLAAGNYRALDRAECAQITPQWERGSGTDRTTHEITGLIHRLKALFAEVQRSSGHITLHPPDCGDRGIDLGRKRLDITAAFGPYFAGLLEREHIYEPITQQLDFSASPGQEGLDPLQRLFWTMQHGKGPHILVIAAEGGMGKSTLAARIVRCLLEEQAVDVILGDSAKRRQIDVLTGQVTALEPGYYDPHTCYHRLSAQLGLPLPDRSTPTQEVVQAISDRLINRRAIIVVDNLETVEESERLVHSLQQLASRDVRIVITTRSTAKISIGHQVLLRPLDEVDSVRRFLRWHVWRYRAQQPALERLELGSVDARLLLKLIERTGGIPLLLQLVAGDIARSSWHYPDHLPYLFGPALLDYLYQERWQELGRHERAGHLAQSLLQWIASEQQHHHQVDLERLSQWAKQQEEESLLPQAITLLNERFLLVNNDPQQGHFALFPSLVAFLEQIGGN